MHIVTGNSWSMRAANLANALSAAQHSAFHYAQLQQPCSNGMWCVRTQAYLAG
jgi:hypothetical protein